MISKKEKRIIKRFGNLRIRFTRDCIVNREATELTEHLRKIRRIILRRDFLKWWSKKRTVGVSEEDNIEGYRELIEFRLKNNTDRKLFDFIYTKQLLLKYENVNHI